MILAFYGPNFIIDPNWNIAPVRPPQDCSTGKYGTTKNCE
jgi:hypothetical protein